MSIEPLRCCKNLSARFRRTWVGIELGFVNAKSLVLASKVIGFFNTMHKHYVRVLSEGRTTNRWDHLVPIGWKGHMCESLKSIRRCFCHFLGEKFHSSGFFPLLHVTCLTVCWERLDSGLIPVADSVIWKHKLHRNVGAKSATQGIVFRFFMSPTPVNSNIRHSGGLNQNAPPIGSSRLNP